MQVSAAKLFTSISSGGRLFLCVVAYMGFAGRSLCSKAAVCETGAVAFLHVLFCLLFAVSAGSSRGNHG